MTPATARVTARAHFSCEAVLQWPVVAPLLQGEQHGLLKESTRSRGEGSLCTVAWPLVLDLAAGLHRAQEDLADALVAAGGCLGDRPAQQSLHVF